MNVQEVTAEIKKMPEFAGFVWTIPEAGSTNAHAHLVVKNECFKDSEKNEYLLGGTYSLFVAHMYAGQKGKEFFYLTLCRHSKMRIFRKHNFEEIEYNKIFASGNTVKKIMKSLNGYFTNCNYKFL